MHFPGQKWEEVAPEAEGLDAKRLAAAVAYLRENSGRDGVSELVIVRRGRIVWCGENIDKLHGTWSCTKSLTGTALGLLIDDGKCTLDTPAKDFAPELAAKYPELKLRHFATMTSGYRAEGDEPQGSYLHGPSETPFRPSEPLFAPPGSQYAYWDSAMNMFGLVLTRIAKQPLADLLRRRIAEPIGMNPKAWSWGNRGTLDGLLVNGGAGNAGAHVQISARELARFGHLFLSDGNWNGSQLISRQWVRAATKVHVPANLPWAQPESEIDGRGVYGLNWWVQGKRASGRPIWPGVPGGTFAAAGHNNNRLFVVPAWQMVVVRLGLDQQDGKIKDETWARFLELIGEARAD
jgi:CubicO group peptidase (beta-lactamase class C family)